ncbi:MAG: hypothetical protein KGJ35_01930 [Patescibacteria group bacterium]|nr:hypothetical protein [Patescibacteria group bacterium]
MNNQETNQAVTEATGGIRLIINGGSDIVESATVPIQWFFSPEVIRKNPTKLLIIEQSEMLGEYKPSSYNDSDEGARYLVKVTDLVTFIQFFAPGKHCIAVLALDETECDTDRMRRRGERRYHADISVSRIRDAIKSGDFRDVDPDVVGATIKEIDVPQELFAHRTQSKFGTMVWKWTNLWHEIAPRDQCQYRRRLIFAFTLQPFIWMIGMILRFFIQVFGSIVYPLIRLIVFFFGFKPNFIFKHLGEIWKWDHDPRNDFDDLFLSEEVSGYRVWSVNNGKTRYMPITGIELACLLFVAWSIKTIIANLTISLFLALGIAIVVTSIVFMIVMRLKPREDDELLAARRRESYETWLRNLAIDQAPTKISLNALPAPYHGGLVQKLRVGYWYAKIKVCKPYSLR